MDLDATMSTSDRVAEKLLEIIRINSLSSGDMIPSERELMEEFGVSRLACREAIAKLQGMGILKARHGKGVFLANIRSMTVNPEALRLLQISGLVRNADILQARLVIEPPSARYAAQNAKPHEREHIKELMKDAERDLVGLGVLDRAKRYAEADVVFHQAVAAATGNPVFPMLLKSMHELLYRIRFEVLILKPDIIVRGMEDHERIADAIAAHDAEGAEAAMERHIRIRGAELIRDELSQPDSRTKRR